jgi:hypothetical protein
MPVYEYDHVEDYAVVLAHDPENLALLCPNHHQDKTSGRLSKESIVDARRSPHNTTKAETTPYSIERTKTLRVFVGSNEIYALPPSDCSVVWINGESFVSVHWEGGSFTYSVRVTDETGGMLLRIDRGALVVATDVWDYRYEGRTVSIRGAPGRILLEAEIADRHFGINRGWFVDQFSTGLLVRPTGVATVIISGVEVGSFAAGRSKQNTGAFAVVRGSCCDVASVPEGFAFVRKWPSAYEERMADMKRRMEDGGEGPFPPGLSEFVPCPQNGKK